MFVPHKYVNKDIFVINLQAKNAEEAIRALIDRIFSISLGEGRSIEKEKVYKEVLAREAIQSTGVGNGFAFPHARIEGWGDFAMVIGICTDGVDFKSVDKKPVKIVSLMVSSAEEPYLVLKGMSFLAKFFKQTNLMDRINENNFEIDKIVAEMKGFQKEPYKTIVAGDIARPIKHVLKLNDSIEKATRMMHLNSLEIIPVVDNSNKFCGEISCLDIFQYGMPDFFHQLHTVSFLRNLDPFEKYFTVRGKMEVKDFVKKTKPISADFTILEIVFEMAVKNRQKMFVVNKDNELKGMIDRFSIIDKILFF